MMKQEIPCADKGCRRIAALRSTSPAGVSFYVCGAGHPTRLDADGMGRQIGAKGPRDVAAAREQRELGMERAVQRDPTLVDRVRAVVRATHHAGDEVTGEDVRLQCVAAGVDAEHPNAWGAVVNALVRSGQLEDTGRMKHMETERSHARRTPIYRVTG